MSHKNDGNCSGCQDIINKYLGIHPSLLDWFKRMQKLHPEMHLSCAGRGKDDQESAFKKGASRAHYGQSAHNYNCAIDLFCDLPGKDLYDTGWFFDVVGTNIPDYLEWYGMPDAAFHELPHVEIKAWKQLRDSGLVQLVE